MSCVCLSFSACHLISEPGAVRPNAQHGCAALCVSADYHPTESGRKRIPGGGLSLMQGFYLGILSTKAHLAVAGTPDCYTGIHGARGPEVKPSFDYTLEQHDGRRLVWGHC